MVWMLGSGFTSALCCRRIECGCGLHVIVILWYIILLTSGFFDFLIFFSGTEVLWWYLYDTRVGGYDTAGWYDRRRVVGFVPGT